MITEKEFEQQVKDLAKLLGVDKYYHPFLSKWSQKGFPDLTIVKVPRVIFAELKNEKREPTREQEEWLSLLRQCNTIESYLWRPDDIEDIVKILRGQQVE